MTDDEVRFDFIIESPSRLKRKTVKCFKGKKYSNVPYYSSVLDSFKFGYITVRFKIKNK